MPYYEIRIEKFENIYCVIILIEDKQIISPLTNGLDNFFTYWDLNEQKKKFDEILRAHKKEKKSIEG